MFIRIIRTGEKLVNRDLGHLIAACLSGRVGLSIHRKRTGAATQTGVAARRKEPFSGAVPDSWAVGSGMVMTTRPSSDGMKTA